MVEEEQGRKDEVFEKAPDKTYGLMELVDGTSPLVEKKPEDLIDTCPFYIVPATLCVLAATLVLLIFSWLVNAPLDEMASPLITPNPGKAPWYFTGIQELIHFRWAPPAVMGVIIPAIIVIWLFFIPYIDTKKKRTVLLVLFTLFVFGTVVLTVIGSLFRGANWTFVVPWG
ncbi:MAG: menaquinol oxidoreductase [Proteobacteria bacterium]|nr:menaquinol oxidoreductase [Pseudomonadota bacterium]